MEGHTQRVHKKRRRFRRYAFRWCTGRDCVRASLRVAENIGTVTISRFEIRSIETYDRPVGGRKGVITIGSSLNPHRTTTGLVGSSAINGVAGASVLMSYKLTVWSVTYADGKTWTRAPAERS